MKKSNNYLAIGGVAAVAALLWFFRDKIKGFFQKTDEPQIIVVNTPTPSGSLPSVATQPTQPIILRPTEPEAPVATSSDPGASVMGWFDWSDQQIEGLLNGSCIAQQRNNPGNIMGSSSDWQGLDKGMPWNKPGQVVKFQTPDYGVRAMCKLLLNYYKLHGCDTLRKIINRWAPPVENPTDSYVTFVAKSMDVNPDTVVNIDSMRQFLAAMAYHMHRFEAGYYWLPRTKFLEWAKKV